MRGRAFWCGALCAVAAAGGAESVRDGLVEPVRDVWLGPMVAGQVSEVHVGEGAEVKTGERIVSLADRVQRLEVERRRIVREDASELRAAEARLALMQEDVKSTRDLFETTASVSREELRRKEVEARLAEIDVDRLRQAEEREQAELEIAQARLEMNQIRAPFAGIVAEVRVDAGENVRVDQEVVRLVDMSEAFLVMNLPAELAAELTTGESATVRFGPGQDVGKTGTVAFVSPVIDPGSGLRRVKIHFVNTPPRVVPGQVGFWVEEDPAHD